MNGSLILTIVGFAALIGAFWVLAMVLEKRKAGTAPAAEGKGGEDRPRVVKREWLLDHGSEARFYGVLEEAVARVHGTGKCRVMVQVPLCRLVKVEEGLPPGERQTWQNKIDRKTVDYVVCEMPSLRAMFAVELDGSTHDAPKRKKRDGFVDRVLQTAGVRLVRIDRRQGDCAVEEVARGLKAVCDAGQRNKATAAWRNPAPN